MVPAFLIRLLKAAVDPQQAACSACGFVEWTVVCGHSNNGGGLLAVPHMTSR